MAALQITTSQPDRVVLQIPFRRKIGALINLAFWVLVLAFIVTQLLNNIAPDAILFIVFLFFAFSGLSSLVSLLSTTRVTIDRTNRTITRADGFLGIPFRTAQANFNDIDRLAVESYRAGRRAVYPVARLAAITRDNKKIVLNWEGTDSEMRALADKLGLPVGLGAEPVAPITFPQFVPELSPPAPPPEPAPARIEPAPANVLLPEAPLEEPAAFETKPEPARDLANQPLAVLEQIIADDPTNSDAYYALARAYADQGRNRDALEAFAETVKYDPTNIAAQNDLGVMLFAQGQRVEAESALRRATALDPFSSTAHLNLALLLRATGRGQEANAEFAQARTNARDNRERALAESAALGRGVEMQLWGV